jgi:hypothetical protein
MPFAGHTGGSADDDDINLYCFMTAPLGDEAM